MNNVPLSIRLGIAKTRFVKAFNEAQAETMLPACLVEGIVMEIVADIRERKNIELLADYNASVKQGDTTEK